MTTVDEPVKRLRVVYLDHVARLSGAEIALLRLLPALQRYVDSTVILGEDGPLVERLQQAGIETEVLPLPDRLRDVRKDTVKPSGLDRQALSHLPRYVKQLANRIRELEADIVHTNSLKAALYGGVAARVARVPVVWHVRDRIAADYLPVPAVALVRGVSLLLPTAIIANSRSTLDTLPRRAQNHVLYNPIVVPDSIEDPPERKRKRGGPITVGVVGRLAKWKGQDVFLRAFAQAFGGSGARGRLIGSAMFGEDEYARSLEELVRELGIGRQIEFRGFRDDVWQELAELDVLVHCSVTPEPFGQVVLEGMAASLPVIAANEGGPAEMITDGVDGLLTEPGSVEELAEALRMMHEQPWKRDALAAAGKRRSQEFTPERSAGQLMEVYRGLLGAPAR